MKNEEKIVRTIANASGDKTLRFQVIIKNKTLHVYINRPAESALDYGTLKQKIYGAIAEFYPGKFRQISLYCRILGKIEPDWQSVLELEPSTLAAQEMNSMVDNINTAVDATNSIVSKIEQELIESESLMFDSQLDFEDLPTTADDELSDIKEEELSELLEDSILELDLSQYCFIRNRRLLYAVLDPPWSNIARLIEAFDRFDLATKRSQLPVLEAYFENNLTPDWNILEPETQNWWSKIIALDSDNRHKLAIWLSRYCLNAEQTLISVREVFETQTISQEVGSSSSGVSKSSGSSSPSLHHQPDLQIEEPFSQPSSWLSPIKTLFNNFLKIIRRSM
ncbi:MAG: hypothetical protein AAFQ80_12005 [Cyanobacteria bacterium J06621_8]